MTRSLDDLFTDEDRAHAARIDGGIRGLYSGGIPAPYYDRHGRPITLGQWCVLFEKFEAYRIVRQTTTRAGAWISTVWIGLDHGLFLDGPPLIFESMVFVDGEDLQQDRYATEAAAIAGHESLVEKYGGRDHDGPQESR